MYLRSADRMPNRIGILTVLVAPIKNSSAVDNTLYNALLKFMEFCLLRVQYNSQQASLQALLNRLFDAEFNRIRLITASDVITVKYGRVSVDADNVTSLYGKLASEGDDANYGYINPDFATAFSGYVEVPSALMPSEAVIKKWIDYNIWLDKTYKIIYI